jgi:predicted naringenin-chalcone synthase
MAVYLHHIETLVPVACHAQQQIADLMKRQLGTSRKLERLIQVIYSQSGIEKRHTVIPDFESSRGLFFAEEERQSLSTGSRNQLYRAEASKLFCDLAFQTIRQARSFDGADISHIITVSCTGFFAPGPDYLVTRMLGLPASVERYHLGFMGCYAALSALKMAQAFCQANPSAVVLVLCAELCSLHLQNSTLLDDIVAASVFADGAAAAIVSSREPLTGAFRLEQFESSLIPAEAEMAWTIGDEGFKMVLSSYVPQLIASNLAAALAPLLTRAHLPVSDIDHWAVHPGGRAILDKVEHALELPKDKLAFSRTILRQYGNMSSPTILFILAEALVHSRPAESILALAFGLTVESALLSRV